MKYILITGKNSYIGTSTSNWLTQFDGKYKVDRISLRDSDWNKQSWAKYDVVLNVIGKAHQPETEENKSEYYKINRDLSIKIANKAKNDGVNYFIQISTMSVFGKNEGIIDRNTLENPMNHYGFSKLEADREIVKFNNSVFKTSIIRPPMVYGENSPGNYQKLSKFISTIKIFPKINNQRSMIHIDNLTEFIRLLIENRLEGYFYPQNENFVNTFELAEEIAKVKRFKLLEIPNLLNWTNFFMRISPQARKVFGNLVYDLDMSRIYSNKNEKLNYTVRSLEESVKLTESEK